MDIINADDGTAKYIAIGTLMGNVIVLKPSDGTIIMKYKAHDDHVRSISFGENSDVIVTGSSGGIVRRWDLSGRVAAVKR